MDIDNTETFVQLILIETGVRNAWLVESQQYKKLNSILRSYFKNLIKSYTNYGMIVSKNNYNKHILNDKSLGDILGYPCSDDFAQISTNNVDGYCISVNCELENGNTFQIFVNKAVNLEKIKNFEKIVEESNKILTSHRLTMNKVKKVYLDVKKTFSFDTIKNAINKNNVDIEIMKEFINFLWNYGYDNSILNFKFDFSNHTHKIVGLMLLSQCENDVLEQFYPFNKNMDMTHEKTMIKLSENVYEILKL